MGTAIFACSSVPKAKEATEGALRRQNVVKQRTTAAPVPQCGRNTAKDLTRPIPQTIKMASADGNVTAESGESKSKESTVSKDASSKKAPAPLNPSKEATTEGTATPSQGGEAKPEEVKPSPVKATSEVPPPTTSRRRPKSNLFFAAFYHLALWTILALLSGPFFAFFAFKDPQERYPTYYGYRGFIGEKPKLNMIPDIAGFKENKQHKSVLYFEANQPKSYDGFVDMLQKFIAPYQKKPMNGIDCVTGTSFDPNVKDEDIFCMMNIYDKSEEFGLGLCALPKDEDDANAFDFGFGETKPCFVLKLNKLLDYIPDAPEATELSLPAAAAIDAMCGDVEDCCHRYRLEFTCSTDDPNTEFVIYPTAGISLCHWPFRGQPGYLSPFAMLRIVRFAAPGTDVKITCSAKTDLLKGENIHIEKHILTFRMGLLVQGTVTDD